tara:strand:+ start:88 stop:798 length:711 start_codon:yes stop_codon:yes gene_type:complete
MKKLLLVLTIVAGTTFSASAQIAQGSILVDTYYGFTNLPGAIYNDAWNTEAGNWNGGEATTSSFGPIGLRAEYMTSDKLSIGIDFALNLNSASFTGEDYDYNNIDTTTGNYQTISFTAEGSSTKWGAMVTLNYHFVTNSVVDFYLTGGVGYKNRTSTLDQNNPNFTNNGEADNVAFEDYHVNLLNRVTALTPETSIPLAARLGLGLRVFFTDNIGANIGLGFGQGGILNAGLSVAL